MSYTIKNVEAFCEFIDAYIAREKDFSCAEALQAYRDAQPKIPAEGEGVTVILNYGPKSHAIFGEDTRGIKDELMALNEPKKLVSFSSKLEFGSGWVIMDKTKLKKVLALLDEHDIAHTEIEREDFVSSSTGTTTEKPKKVVSKTSAKKPAPKEPVKSKAKKVETSKETRVSEKSDTEEDEPKPKTKAVAKKVTAKAVKTPVKTVAKKVEKAPAKKTAVVKKAPPAKEEGTRLKAKKNEQGNFVEEETGLVFVKAPIGTGGREVSIVVGVQNPESEEQGLASVNPLDSDMISECEERKWQYLTAEFMKLISKRNPELHDELKELESRGNTGEGQDEGGDDGAEEIEGADASDEE